MFDFGDANKSQKEAIAAVDGPVLITAGPGTGKTFTLVQRAIYLIQERGVEPEQIFIATFTEKAAKELVTRITNELAARKISVNVNEMYVGTFHSICLRIIKENLEFTRLKRNYRMLDSFDQQYLVFQNIDKFKRINNIEKTINESGSWRLALAICGYVNRLTEEMVDVDAMAEDNNLSIMALADILKVYQKILVDQNLIDFSTIQTECYKLLVNNHEILQQLQEKIKYIMVDEYQDTNYIQEQIVFLLAGDKQNICVVGDDDQGLYRFRGATIRNILEFPSKFKGDKQCRIIPLVVNYRSDSDIVDFYNKWMAVTGGHSFKFDWGKYRYPKTIEAFAKSTINSPCVVKLSSFRDESKWHENILNFINKLMHSGKVKNYNQIAFLFSSVKNKSAISLAKFLESNGISVYSPRSDMFFKRNEIMLTLGCMMLMFKEYVIGLKNGEYKHLQQSEFQYYEDCICAADELLKRPENRELKNFISQRRRSHSRLKKTTDYAYSGLLYRLFTFEPFSSILGTDLDAGVVDIRPTRNLAQLTQIIGKFEYLYNINVLSGRYIKQNTELLFNLYLRLLIAEGIAEYEDDAEYAPSGCVSFLTIHQSKGMEFPIVFVDSLYSKPRISNNELMNEVEDRYSHRPAFEPAEYTKFFDFWRLYYTAFSRAQNLLVLTCNENYYAPSIYFSGIYNGLEDVSVLDLNEFDFAEVKKVNIKDTFSFTSHIAVYETCALQYKFYKELGFVPIRQGAMMFGTLVHETIEDIHRAAIRNETEKITPENIADWFASNYASLVMSNHGYLGEQQKDAALKQVLRYAKRQKGKWDKIKQAEVDVSLVMQDYIIDGKIDLIKGDRDTVELVDFKSERKPDPAIMKDRIERYRRQLCIYAYLVEERTGQKVSKLNLYYTGEGRKIPVISFPYKKRAIKRTVEAFDKTVHKILKRDFSHCANDAKICANCDFRYYCKNKQNR